MPSTFDNLFAADATPELASLFGRAITVVANSGDSGTTTYSPSAQVGREVIRRVRTNDGIKVIRARDVLVSTVAVNGVTPLPAAVVRTLVRATVDGVNYIVSGASNEPGQLAKLTLERSDPSDISRPNQKNRR